MARIFYSLSGEGRGHATRAMAIAEQLGELHDLTLFAYGDAYALLAPRFRRSSVRVRPIRGIRFKYAGQRLDYFGTVLGGARFAALRSGRITGHLERLVRAERPDLVVTDFEPCLPRAARRCGVPFVSLDHQHFLVVSDLSSLPFHLRCYGDFIGLSVRACCRGPQRIIVSSFYSPPVKRAFRDRAVQVGVLLRPDVLGAEPERRGHLAVYVRRLAPEALLGALSACGLSARIYGMGVLPPRGGASFHEVSVEGFLEDLATSEALVCTAGNQLVGEALYLGKPVLALPEPGNFEQRINAHFVRQSGAGDWAPMESAGPERLRGFLDRLEGYRAAIDPAAVAGNARALQALEPFLNRGC
jgi:uncharacterized protein (TIGR00661 family)